MRGDKTLNDRSNRHLNLNWIQTKNTSFSFSKPHNPIHSSVNTRNLLSGKIVKNGIRSNKSSNSDLLNNISHKIVSSLQSSYNRKNTRTQLENLKSIPKNTIRPIGRFNGLDTSNSNISQNKYRVMLGDYSDKKKNITSELNLLKQSSTLNIDKFQLKQNINSSCSLTNKNNQTKYQTLNSELLALEMKLKRKQKITEIYPLFFDAIQKQISLEEELRSMKKTINPQQKQQLQETIKQNKQLEGKITLELHPQQFDPFEVKSSVVAPIENLPTKLIEKYKQCQEHWKQQICQLKPNQSAQIFYALNFEKVQQISLKSFVRQLNYLIHKQLRVRQLFAIYNRLYPLTQPNFCAVTSQKQ